MIPCATISTIDELASLLTAAMTLEAAGGEVIRGSTSIELDIPLRPEVGIVAMGDWQLGPAFELVQIIFDKARFVPPRTAGGEIQPGYVRVSRDLPSAPSGHEVLAATTLLTDALRKLRFEDERIAELLAMKEGFWTIPF